MLMFRMEDVRRVRTAHAFSCRALLFFNLKGKERQADRQVSHGERPEQPRLGQARSNIPVRSAWRGRGAVTHCPPGYTFAESRIGAPAFWYQTWVSCFHCRPKHLLQVCPHPILLAARRHTTAPELGPLSAMWETRMRLLAPGVAWDCYDGESLGSEPKIISLSLLFSLSNKHKAKKTSNGV